jgi:hypothetical protein
VLSGSINLTMLVGPVIPIPAPKFVVDALESVTVTSTAERGKDSGFELVFTLDKRSLITTLFVVSGGSIPPVLRVILVATVSGHPTVLIDGVVTEQQTAPGDGPGRSTLTVKGVDLTAVMGYIDFTGTPFPAMPPEARVALLLAKYSFLGVIPLIIPSIVPDTPNPTEQIPAQRGTDLAYIRYLAERSGYIFTLIPGPTPGNTFGYWGPDAKVGVPMPALNTDMDALTNVDKLSFTVDTEHRELPIIYIQNKETKTIVSVPIPDISPLNPPLGLVSPPPKKVRHIRETAKLTPTQAVLLGMAKASQTSDTVRAEGSLDVMRYGRLLSPRRLVGVRGAGLAFDGLYFVQRVQHQIRRGEYKQQFSLVRNGLIPTIPLVPV